MSLESPWWRHQMETFSALLAICAGNSPASGKFSAQRPVTRGFDVLRKQLWGWWFETLSRLLWRHCNGIHIFLVLSQQDYGELLPNMNVTFHHETSSNGIIFRVTGHLCGEFIGHKGQWRGALKFSLICAWINGWVNNREAGDSRRHRAHYDVTVMTGRLLPDDITKQRKWLTKEDGLVTHTPWYTKKCTLHWYTHWL